jgi:hypothetical protein
MGSETEEMKKRLCTNRDFIDNSVEYISIDDNGYFWWEGEENGGPENTRWESSFGFLVDLDFVKDFFIKCGRSLDISKLPPNYKLNPYQNWM